MEPEAAFASYRDLVATLQARRGADPQTSYVAQLYAKGLDAILKKLARRRPKRSWPPRMGYPMP